MNITTLTSRTLDLLGDCMLCQGSYIKDPKLHSLI